MAARITRTVAVFLLGAMLGILAGWRTAPALEGWREQQRIARIVREEGMDLKFKVSTWAELETEMRRIEGALSKEGKELFSRAFGAMGGRWLAANRNKEPIDYDAFARILDGLTVRQIIEQSSAHDSRNTHP